MYDFIGHRKIFFIISGILCGVSIIALVLWGLIPGIDFTGGTIMEVNFLNTRPTNIEIREKLSPLNLGEVQIQAAGEQGIILRFKEVDEDTHQEILKILGKTPQAAEFKDIGTAGDGAEIEEIRFESIGPIIGAELTRKARWTVTLAILAIVFYIAWAFRKLARISRAHESWRYGAGALLALVHDVLVLLGFFSIMGHFRGMEVNAAFITALLTVLGYSINDTVVVYDRIRENLLLYGSRDLAATINKSLNETINRCLNTVITTLFALLVICLFGGTTIRDFVLAMMVGIGIGTWSSIAIASPFLLFKRKKI